MAIKTCSGLVFHFVLMASDMRPCEINAIAKNGP